LNNKYATELGKTLTIRGRISKVKSRALLPYILDPLSNIANLVHPIL